MLYCPVTCCFGPVRCGAIRRDGCRLQIPQAAGFVPMPVGNLKSTVKAGVALCAPCHHSSNYLANKSTLPLAPGHTPGAYPAAPSLVLSPSSTHPTLLVPGRASAACPSAPHANTGCARTPTYVRTHQTTTCQLHLWFNYLHHKTCPDAMLQGLPANKCHDQGGSLVIQDHGSSHFHSKGHQTHPAW